MSRKRQVLAPVRVGLNALRDGCDCRRKWPELWCQGVRVRRDDRPAPRVPVRTVSRQLALVRLICAHRFVIDLGVAAPDRLIDMSSEFATIGVGGRTQISQARAGLLSVRFMRGYALSTVEYRCACTTRRSCG